MNRQLEKEYDVIIVGSGATGGMAAYVLARAGVKVLMLEAGRDYDPYTETPMFQRNADAPLRGASTPDKPFGYYDATVDGGWEVPGEPYTVGEGSAFKWWRSRMVGGRTNHWARHVPRFGPDDFKRGTLDGLSDDWPISYEDVAPYYDKAEALIGVIGGDTGVDNEPGPAPGIHQPAPAARVPELLVQAACEDLDIPCTPAPRAILTRPLNGRKACFYATPCIRGCNVGANFQSPTVLLPPALATGNLDIVTNAHVFEVTIDGRGQADGALFVDKTSDEHVKAKARVVVLGASACETARILLLSRNTAFPDGVANATGLIGRHLMDTPGTQIEAHFPHLEGRPHYNEDGISYGHLYIPWWLNEAQRRGELDFARGYHVEFGGSWGREPSMSVAKHAVFANAPYGKAFKEGMRHAYGSVTGFSVRGEMVPNSQTYCELDGNVKDQFGLPVLQFHWQWSDEERRQMRHAWDAVEAIIARAGGRVLNPFEGDDAPISVGGEIIHEIGTARMGDDPGSSVTDPFGRCWDVDNLYLVDGSTFVSNPHKNPTLTMMALAWRTSDLITNRLMRRDH